LSQRCLPLAGNVFRRSQEPVRYPRCRSRASDLLCKSDIFYTPLRLRFHRALLPVKDAVALPAVSSANFSTVPSNNVVSLSSASAVQVVNVESAIQFQRSVQECHPSVRLFAFWISAPSALCLVQVTAKFGVGFMRPDRSPVLRDLHHFFPVISRFLNPLT
jgi:hypothetical protein